jgi:hypothetical protein
VLGRYQEVVHVVGRLRLQAAAVLMQRSVRETVGTIDQIACKVRDSRMFGKSNAQMLISMPPILSQNSLIRGMQLGMNQGVDTTSRGHASSRGAILKI